MNTLVGTSSAADIDSPDRIETLKVTVESKKALNKYYLETYKRFAECLRLRPEGSTCVELGSGASFAQKLIPELKTSDIIPYKGVELVVDATQMPFSDQSIGALVMLNVFHHIPNVEKFLSEAQRVLMPGGRVLIADQNVGPLSSLIFRYLHTEPFNPESRDWTFASSGPLSGANGALAWMVFVRDRAKFEKMYPHLQIVSAIRHNPLFYWLSGGLKKWSLIPDFLVGTIYQLDFLLGRVFPSLCSFLTIELKKV